MGSPLLSFPWPALKAIIFSTLIVYFVGVCLIVSWVAFVAESLYPTGIPDVDYDEIDKPSFTYFMSIFYLCVFFVLSACIAVFHVYFPDWNRAFIVALAVLFCVGSYFAYDLMQWDFRTWPWRFREFAARMSKAFWRRSAPKLRLKKRST